MLISNNFVSNISLQRRLNQDDNENEMGKGVDEKPALQVIVLGSGGGPLEDNTTALLVRSVAAGWKKGSVLAVDAGVHLSAITKILKRHKTEYFDEGIHLPITLADGPLEGLEIQHRTAKANAAHVTRTLIDTCLLTHPHLDHINGFVVNTASLPGSRPKRLAGLPRTIEAIKTHIFNNIIWPNLSDENNGAGLVTYMRLVEGGSPALGDGDGKGYVEICEGLSVKTWSVSHGHCIEKHSHRGSNASLSQLHSQTNESPRLRPRTSSSLQMSPHRERRDTVSSQGNPDLLRINSNETTFCVYDSSAYFIRDIAIGSEVLIFGDLEPDSVSLSPRNKHVWSEAAPKIASGALRGIFIECSYDDSQSTDTLFGHLAPRFLIEELQVLAMEVEEACKGPGNDRGSRKRKRLSHATADYHRPTSPRKPYSSGDLDAVSPLSQPHPSKALNEPRISVTQNDGIPEGNGHEYEGALPLRNKDDLPLKGVKVVIIHMKDKLTDGPHVGETILEQLLEYEKDAQLGCEFVISKVGMSLYL